MGNVHMEATQINYREGDKKMSVAQAIKNAGNTGLAHTADIAPEFSTESAYNAGDFVYHNGSLYEFTANHAAGAWSTADTQAATISNELASLESGLTNLGTYINCSDIIQLETGVTLSYKCLYTNGKELHGCLILDISQLSGTIIGTILSGYRPIDSWRVVSMSYATSSDAGSTSIVTLTTNGEILIDHTDGKPYLVFNFTYPIAN